ncbi:MAG: hypothetical protein JW951_02875 [Lentisphaerae bacterium]|nr:hypothetical protein [Lentisphaerota bacterium]
MTASEKRIRDMIGAVRRRWLRRELRGFAVAGVTLLWAWLALMVAADNRFMLTPGQLGAGWVAGAAALAAWAAACLFRCTWGRPAADTLALRFERRVPGQENRLINAWQFLHGRGAERDAMARAAVLENAARLDPAQAERAVDDRPVRRLAWALGGVLLLIAAYAAWRPDGSLNGLRRVLSPAAPEPHYLAARITVRPGDAELVEGDALRVEADVAVRRERFRPGAAFLAYRTSGFDWKTVRMEAAGGAAYRAVLDAVRQPLEYRVQAGPSATRVYTVGVRKRPRVEDLRVTVEAPAYAGRAPRTLEPMQGNVEALEGSAVRLTVTASAPLREGRLERGAGPAIPLQLDAGDARVGRAALTLAGNNAYRVRLVDRQGTANADPLRYALRAVKDRAPSVSVRRPGRDLVLPADAVLPVAWEAADDIGLGRVVLETSRGSGTWEPFRTWPVPEAARQAAQETEVALRELGLKPDDVLRYRVVAYDGRTPEPNRGVGRSWSVTVAEDAQDENVALAQAKELYGTLRKVLALQRQNRGELARDGSAEAMRSRQGDVRRLSRFAFEREENAVRPDTRALAALAELVNGPMLFAEQGLQTYAGTPQERAERKPELLTLMDAIIAKLEALLGRLRTLIETAEQARARLDELDPEARRQALENIREMLGTLRDFIPEQDQVIEDAEELLRKAEDYTADALQELERLKGTEDRWAKVFHGSVADIALLTEQGFADDTMVNDYKEMVEQIEEASKNMTPKLIELAVPRAQAGRELAESLVVDMEMWVPSSPDHIKWMMEEPLDYPEIPMPDLPDQLTDFIGDLIEEQDALNDLAEDLTSGWADSISAAGWAVSGGPISSFSAKGKTGNQLPDNNEITGRSGEGRSGRSQGQMLESVAKGLRGRRTPTRLTHDPYEQGVVRELQQMATSGATGGGKARGAGQEGLQGDSPPPLYEGLGFMQDWQKRIRQKAVRLAGELSRARVRLPALDDSIALMDEAAEAAQDARYTDMFQKQRMVLSRLEAAGTDATREASLQADTAYEVPPDQRSRVVDAFEEPVAPAYQNAVKRYFEMLSTGE